MTLEEGPMTAATTRSPPGPWAPALRLGAPPRAHIPPHGRPLELATDRIAADIDALLACVEGRWSVF
jgi:hypothetical protein